MNKVIKTQWRDWFDRPSEGIDFYLECDSDQGKNKEVCKDTQVGPTSGTAAQRPDDVYACCQAGGKSGYWACKEMEINANNDAFVECAGDTPCRDMEINAGGDVKLTCEGTASETYAYQNCKDVTVVAGGNVVITCASDYGDACAGLTVKYGGTCSCSGGECPAQSSFTGPGNCVITGGTGGSSSESSCFLPDTPVVMRDGATKAMADVRIGDRLWGGAAVTGTQSFSGAGLRLVDNAGVVSTAAHRVLHEGVFKPSGDLPGAEPFRGAAPYVYDLQTSDHRITALNASGERVVYTDFSEVDYSAAIELRELALLNSAAE